MSPWVTHMATEFFCSIRSVSSPGAGKTNPGMDESLSHVPPVKPSDFATRKFEANEYLAAAQASKLGRIKATFSDKAPVGYRRTSIRGATAGR